MVVERGVALGARLQLVEEVEHDLGQRHAVVHLHAVGADVLHRAHLAAMVLAQVHHRADELLRRDDVGGHHRLDDPLDLAVGELARIGDVVDRVVLRGHLVRHVRRGGDQVESEFAFQALGDDLHVQQAQEAAAEAEAQRHRGLRLVDERRVVELELVERVAQLRVLGVVDREQAGVHHRLRIAVARQRFGGALGGGGDRIADLGLAHVLRAGDHVADLAGTERLGRCHVRADHADLDRIVGHADAHHVQLLAAAQLAVDHADVGHDATVRVVHRIEDQRAGRGVRIALGGGHVHHDLVEQVGHALAGFAGDPQHVRRLAADQAGDLLGVLVRLGAGQVDLVEHGDDGQIVVDGHVQVREGLRLDTLRGVDEQHRALAGGQRAGDLVGEVHMARGVDHAECVFGAVEGPRYAHGLGFDGDAAFLFDVHAVEEAVAHLALGHDAAQLQDAVRHGRLAVVDMRDDAEVTNQRLIGETRLVVLRSHQKGLLNGRGWKTHIILATPPPSVDRTPWHVPHVRIGTASNPFHAI